MVLARLLVADCATLACSPCFYTRAVRAHRLDFSAISPRYLRNYARYVRDTSVIRTPYVRACPRPLRPTRGKFFVSPRYVRGYTGYVGDIYGPGCSQEISRTTAGNTFLGDFPPRGTTTWEISTRDAIKTHVEPGLYDVINHARNNSVP